MVAYADEGPRTVCPAPGPLPHPRCPRRLVHAVLDNHHDGLRDDAAVLFREGNGTAYQRLQDKPIGELAGRALTG
ncbi:hypothetical protein ACIO93_29380 [Streptomyces sp. NPDC087903]|uniref:hypothetical protein n=1 Tax=Streptomyces sp. NPDC087903 TaxID=3365819 RepID=UPI00382E3B70